MMRQTLRILLVVVCLAGAACRDGCSSGKTTSNTKPADNRTPAQYFKEQQAATMTPSGKIKIDTVTERDGKLEYTTEDGKRWRVSYSKLADGTYHFGSPDEVQP